MAIPFYVPALLTEINERLAKGEKYGNLFELDFTSQKDEHNVYLINSPYKETAYFNKISLLYKNKNGKHKLLLDTRYIRDISTKSEVHQLIKCVKTLSPVLDDGDNDKMEALIDKIVRDKDTKPDITEATKRLGQIIKHYRDKGTVDEHMLESVKDDMTDKLYEIHTGVCYKEEYGENAVIKLAQVRAKNKYYSGSVSDNTYKLNDDVGGIDKIPIHDLSQTYLLIEHISKFLENEIPELVKKGIIAEPNAKEKEKIKARLKVASSKQFVPATVKSLGDIVLSNPWVALKMAVDKPTKNIKVKIKYIKANGRSYRNDEIPEDCLEQLNLDEINNHIRSNVGMRIKFSIPQVNITRSGIYLGIYVDEISIIKKEKNTKREDGDSSSESEQE